MAKKCFQDIAGFNDRRMLIIGIPLAGILMSLLLFGNYYEQQNWGFIAMAYLGWVFGTAMPPVPRMGFTPDVVASLHLEGGGLWIDEPWRVMAMGAGYYATIGFIEVSVLPRIAAAHAPRLTGDKLTSR